MVTRAILSLEGYEVLILTVLLLVFVFAFGPAYRTPLAGVIRAFVAFYLIALGLAVRGESLDARVEES